MKKYSILLIFVFLAVLILGLSKFSYASKPSDYGLKEGDLISAIFSDDPDVYIINEHGYKRLFLNPEIFKFYTHLGGFANIKLVTPEVRDAFPVVGLFRNCEKNDPKVYGFQSDNEDSGELRWVNTSGDQAVQDDPSFFKKVFCINDKEFKWYKRGQELKSVKEVPQYHRVAPITPATPATPVMPAIPAIPAVPASHSLPLVSPTVSPGPASTSLSPTPTPTSSIQPAIPAVSAIPIQPASSTPTPTPTPAPTPTYSSTPTSTSSPLPPTSVTASLVADKIMVTWSGTPLKYHLYRSVNGNAYQIWSQVDGFGYDDNKLNLESGFTYRYKVYGCGNADFYGCSYSNGTESNIVTYISSSSTPTPTPTPTPIPTPTASACTDTDGGLDYFIRGVAKGPPANGSPSIIVGENSNISSDRSDPSLGANSIHYDACLDSSQTDYIFEYYCGNDGKVYRSVYICPFGCGNGICNSTPVSFDFSRDLYLGLRGDDVKRLQALLVDQVSYPANLLTGYFGNITRDAVKRLQEKYGVKPTSGFFGEITRQALRVLIPN
ncbi:MAG: peptidoglycan-binding protein [Candidatus Yanofskybacteria bacterium]|nr:peptidoglycan-binding protein [Candidatus Yanofskybacteria bacterium]